MKYAIKDKDGQWVSIVTEFVEDNQTKVITFSSLAEAMAYKERNPNWSEFKVEQYSE